MDRDVDVMGKYRMVTNKLRKRFLKKPNIAEGSEQFAGMAKLLKAQECPQYSAFFHLAQARCENSLSNSPGESQALLQAARDFMDAEMMNRDLKCVSFEEHLTAATNCYSHAIRVLTESKHAPLAAAVCMELGDSLRKCGKPSEALVHYERATELSSQNALQCLECLGYVAACKIQIRDFDGALTVFTEMAYLAQERGGSSMTSKPLGPFVDVLVRCEISRVLLLMLLQPTPQRLRPEHAQTLEKYAWQSGNDDNLIVQFLGENLFLLLQSVVMTCQSGDIESLRTLQTELWPLLSPEQNQLLHLIIKQVADPTMIM